jgi:hypothetical protein
LVNSAEETANEIPLLRSMVEALNAHEAALVPATHELFREIHATLEQATLDAENGSYEIAKRRLSEVQRSRQRLLARLDQRGRLVRTEIDGWLKIPTVVSLYPQLRRYPAQLSSSEIADWFVLREEISDVVLRRSAAQRAKNIPGSEHSGVPIGPEHSLRLDISKRIDAVELERFALAVVKYCASQSGGWIEPSGAVFPDLVAVISQPARQLIECIRSVEHDDARSLHERRE